MKSIVEVVEKTEAFKNVKGKVHIPKYRTCQHLPYLSDDHYACVIREALLSTWHPVGTCKMGAEGDPTAVVDPRLRYLR